MTRKGKHHTKLIDLIKEGFLTPPVELRSLYKSKEYRATIEEDGTITCKSKSYTSLSSAAKHATKTISKAGWDFWNIQDENGDWIPIAKIRKIRESNLRRHPPKQSPTPSKPGRPRFPSIPDEIIGIFVQKGDFLSSRELNQVLTQKKGATLESLLESWLKSGILEKREDETGKPIYSLGKQYRFAVSQLRQVFQQFQKSSNYKLVIEGQQLRIGSKEGDENSSKFLVTVTPRGAFKVNFNGVSKKLSSVEELKVFIDNKIIQEKKYELSADTLNSVKDIVKEIFEFLNPDSNRLPYEDFLSVMKAKIKQRGLIVELNLVLRELEDQKVIRLIQGEQVASGTFAEVQLLDESE